MKIYYPISILGLLCGLPVALCLLFKAFPLGSIGPMVPITGIINLLALPPLLFLAAGEYFQINNWKVPVGILSAVLGAVLAILGANLFMWLTYVFGIMDYQPM